MTEEPVGPGIMAYAGLGLLNAICLMAGLGGGLAVDDAVGTLPLFLFVGLVLGTVVGVLATRAEIRRRF